MKSTLFIIFCLSSFNITIAQLTYVPDDSFENWIETNIAGASDGTPNNDYVVTSAIANPGVFYLEFYAATAAINDFTGLEDFASLSSISVNGQPATSIDLSTFTFGPSSQVQINGNNNMTTVILPQGQMLNLNIQSNPQLTSVQFQSNNTLGSVFLFGNNSITDFDVSNTVGVQAGSSLTVQNNPYLDYLNLANGQCINWQPHLICQPNAPLHE